MKKINFSAENGFTIVEVLIAIIILLITVTSFATLFTSTLRGISSSGERSEALFELQESIERDLKSESESTTGSKGEIDLVFNNVTIRGEHRTFTRTTNDGKEVVFDVFVKP